MSRRYGSISDLVQSRTPIRLAVLLQSVPHAAALCSQIEAAIVDRSLPIRFNYTENFGNAMLKTEWRNEAMLIKFCDEFFPRDATADAGLDPPTAGGNGGASSADLFTMALTVLPVLNPWNTELSRRLIDHIHQVTGACVFYPSKEMFADQPPSYFIKAGDVASVLQAGKYLLGLTMFQVSFTVPSNVQLNLQETLDWQRDLLVHTAVEPVFSNSNENGNGGGKTEFLHNRAVLRSFEFCLNSVYFVRSLLLGFKKTVQSSHYNFMTDVKHMIPYSIFSEGQLYFPLYAIDDDRSFDFDTVGVEFFQKFYGGPYSPKEGRRGRETRGDRKRSESPAHLDSVTGNSINADLTSRLKSLLNISSCATSGSSDATVVDLSALMTVSTADTIPEEQLDVSDRDTKCESTGNDLESKAADISMESVEFARDSPSSVLSPAALADDSVNAMAPVEPLLSDSPPPANAISFIPFNQSTPVRGGDNAPPMVVFANCSIAATAPDTVDHEDDPELQAILRRAMPCLQVTQQQVKSMDLDRIARALMTADGLAIFTNAPAVPFVPSAYAVSYPPSVDAVEFERQFREFVRMRNGYLKVHRAKPKQSRKDDFSEVNDGNSFAAGAGNNGKTSRLRRSSF